MANTFILQQIHTRFFRAVPMVTSAQILQDRKETISRTLNDKVITQHQANKQASKQAGKPRRQGQKDNKGRQNNQQAETRRGNRQQGNRRGPPAFALAACETKSVGNSCSMTTNRGNLTGQYVMTPDQQKACRPNRS
jgi:pyruvate carboxylase